MIMMKCGHAANAKSNGKPCCAICIGIIPGADEVAPPPNLSGRMASCCYCDNVDSSEKKLAFFKHWPDRDRDEYYCGCRGWD